MIIYISDNKADCVAHRQCKSTCYHSSNVSKLLGLKSSPEDTTLHIGLLCGATLPDEVKQCLCHYFEHIVVFRAYDDILYISNY
jgi:hypothetical protein